MPGFSSLSNRYVLSREDVLTKLDKNLACTTLELVRLDDSASMPKSKFNSSLKVSSQPAETSTFVQGNERRRRRRRRKKKKKLITMFSSCASKKKKKCSCVLMRKKRDAVEKRM